MSNQEFSTPQDALAHYGVKGMRWGVRKDDYSGASRATNRDARKDASEFARAKMFYGEGAGTRRKLIKAKVEYKSKVNPTYKAAFDHHLSKQDLSKHADAARSERKRKNAVSGTAKTARGVHRSLTGGFGSVSMASAAIATAYLYAKQTGADKVVMNSMKQGFDKIRKTDPNMRAAKEFLKNMGMK